MQIASQVMIITPIHQHFELIAKIIFSDPYVA